MTTEELKIDEEAERNKFEETLAAATETPVEIVRNMRKGDEYRDLVITGIWQGWRWRAALAVLTGRNITVQFTADMSMVKAEVGKLVAEMEAEIAELRSKLEQATK